MRRKSVCRKVSRAGLLIVPLFLLWGCLISQKVPEKFYYTLIEETSTLPGEVKRATPLNLSAWVTETSVDFSYRKKQIVRRHEGPRISYLENHQWADDLGTKIPQLIGSRLVAANLFRELTGKNTYSRPDLEISSFVKRIEYEKEGGKAQAIISLNIQLWELQGQQLVVTESEGQYPLKDDRIETFVEKVNEIILETCDRFSRDVQEYYEPESTE